MPDAPVDLGPFLLKLFRAHSVDGSLDGEWVRLPRPYARVQAAVVSETPHPGSIVVQLDVRMVVDFGRVIGESFAGIGPTREEAVRHALQAFAAGSLHVLLAAFFDKPHEQVEREEWTIGGLPRQVFVGPAVAKGDGLEPETFVFNWFPALRRRIEAADLAEGTHWVRVYVGGTGEGEPEVEVLLDNEPWPHARAALAAREWPGGKGFFSTRVFLVMRGGVDVAEAAAQLYERRDQPIEAAVDEMVLRGVPRARAELAAALVPLAFGRLLLKPLGVRLPDTATLLTTGSGRDGRKIRLSAHPVFRQADVFARQAMKWGALGKDEFGWLAMASPEVQAVNELLDAGSKAENLALVAPIVLVSEDAAGAGAGLERGSGATAQAARGTAAGGAAAGGTAGPAPSASSAPRAGSKRWWRFW